MSIHPVYGHQRLLKGLSGALVADRFPAACLLTGPQGVGKQRIALWLAQSLLCESAPGPCGTCHSCVQAQKLTHPDMHWFVPFPPPKRRASDPDKQIEDVDETIAEIIAERRENPLYARPEPNASHSVASARLMLRKLALKPFQGSRKVLILGDADRLVVQGSTFEAPNSLLKLLEEPPPGTYLLLTTHVPQGLLPTIRSRLVTIRVPPVTDAAVLEFLEREMGVTGREASKQAERAHGAIGTLVGPKTRRSSSDAAERLFKAIKAGPAQCASLALSQPPWGARADFTDLLDAAAMRLRRQIDQQAVDDSEDVVRPLHALRVIHEMREDTLRNVNPQLGIALLAQRLGRIK